MKRQKTINSRYFYFYMEEEKQEATLEDLKTNGPPKLLAEGKEFPFLILAPQNPYKRKWWNTRAVMQLLDTIIEIK